MPRLDAKRGIKTSLDSVYITNSKQNPSNEAEILQVIVRVITNLKFCLLVELINIILNTRKIL